MMPTWRFTASVSSASRPISCSVNAPMFDVRVSGSVQRVRICRASREAQACMTLSLGKWMADRPIAR